MNASVRRQSLLASSLLLTVIAACADSENGVGSEVSGSLLRMDGSSVELVDGAAFDDESDGGTLRVLLGSFPFGCEAVVDGLGFNTPPDGVYVEFVPLAEDEDAEIFEAEMIVGGVQTNRTLRLSFEASVVDDGSVVSGDVTLGGGGGNAEFVVEHCGSADPF